MIFLIALEVIEFNEPIKRDKMHNFFAWFDIYISLIRLALVSSYDFFSYVW